MPEVFIDSWSDWLQTLLAVLPNTLLQPNHRLFWPLILSGLVVAVVVFSCQQRSIKRGIQGIFPFFQWRLWWNTSTLQDVALLLSNALVKQWLLLPWLGGRIAAAMAVAYFLQLQYGTSQLAGATNTGWLLASAILALYSIIFFVVEDASRFSLHYAMHRVPLLWRLHRWHHSATTMTPLTLHRVHPLEACLYHFRSLLVFALLAGGFTYLFSSPAVVWQILGVDLLGFLFNACAANLRHSHVPLSFGRLERWFISPAQHQIHHSADIQHRDKNFGTCLACWDRLRGSWVVSKPAEKLQFGL